MVLVSGIGSAINKDKRKDGAKKKPRHRSSKFVDKKMIEMEVNPFPEEKCVATINCGLAKW